MKRVLKKQNIFKLLACLLPLVFILFIELLLRGFGYGHDTSLFVEYPADPSKLVMNRYASDPFFSDTINATKGFYEPFEKQKQTGTLRIFVLGESTAAGYPYFHNGSFHRWLAYRLMHSLPDQKIEVINLALTAVNSYTVLNFARQVVNYQPDAVLVYVGHNEYYGALGVGSTSRIGSSSGLINSLVWLRRFRTVQLVQNLLFSIRSGGKPSNSVNLSENLMKRMVGKQQMPFNGDDYKKGITQFETNMQQLTTLFSEKHIPLLISNLVSNEKDLKPFISTSATDRYSANREFNSATDALKKGDYPEAKKHFLLAKDFDELRFRAPEAMNQIIIQAARKPSVYVVNARDLFEEHSANRILGNETLLEHVHPNLLGYALLSDGFYEALKKIGVFHADTAREMSFKTLLAKMPVTKVDSLAGIYQIMILRSGWPFNQPISKDFNLGQSMEERLAGQLSVNHLPWAMAMDQLFKGSMSTGNKLQALKATEAVLLENPENTTYYMYAARLNFDLGKVKDAEYYFLRCYQIDPSYKNAQNLYLLYLKLDKPSEAMNWLKVVEAKNGMNADYEPMLKLVTRLVQAKKELTAQPQNQNLRMEIAGYYEKMGEPQVANNYR
ncbi:SGNH/GDSL hydrolase family protein [Mucilaginibacter sp. RS28]|uniref:SGNH/GDSL hydrolase family protein n=1 Tax=Mucilaginibacter straminoryzae TaxID=2932774 RepID=A0A9X1X0J6_9SPHI|nr:SGNH/GDSL hydrolase family protein [Mucilaginibacter straminoryzae]MCJ8209017.1 SGNH/GDSL hydrolase family protein [Mucilaginibacter straminoryzae]